MYYLFNNTDQSRPNVNCDKYTYCLKCFEGIKQDTVPIGDDPAQACIEVKKSLFTQMKNDHEEPEAFVQCEECGRKWHQICALYMEQIFSKFTCDTCIREKKLKDTAKKSYSSSKLARTQLGDFLENKVCIVHLAFLFFKTIKLYWGIFRFKSLITRPSIDNELLNLVKFLVPFLV